MSNVYGRKSCRTLKYLESYKHYQKCNQPVTIFPSQDNSFTSVCKINLIKNKQ